MVSTNDCISTRPNETGHFVRTMWLLGSELGSFTYAILLTLTISCFGALRKRKSGNKWMNRCLGIYVVFAALMGAAALALSIKETLRGVLDVTCIGPKLQPPAPYDLRTVVIYVSINLMTDGLLVSVFHFPPSTRSLLVDRSGGVITLAGALRRVVGQSCSGWYLYLSTRHF